MNGTPATAASADPPERSSSERRVGRPRRVTRAMIADAAYEIGLPELTMRAVADRLGVSATSLYYHVRDRDDLTRLVADYSAAKLVPPRDRGQHWTRWLLEWAEYTRAAFVSQPGLLEQFLNGTIELERMLPNIELVMAVMEREGFEPDDAMRAYALVSDVAVGSAVTELRRGGPPAKVRPSFQDQICTVLVGIAVRRGDDPLEVITRLGGKTPTPVALELFHP